eukprot:266431-Amphidinium_carterae.1
MSTRFPAMNKICKSSQNQPSNACEADAVERRQILPQRLQPEVAQVWRGRSGHASPVPHRMQANAVDMDNTQQMRDVQPPWDWGGVAGVFLLMHGVCPTREFREAVESYAFARGT